MNLNYKIKQYSVSQYSLIEVVLAVVVVSVGLVGVISMTSYSLESKRDSVSKSIAVDAADQFLRYSHHMIKNNWDVLSAFPDTKLDESYDDALANNQTLAGWSNNSLTETENFNIRFLTEDREALFDPNDHDYGLFLYEQLLEGGALGFNLSMRTWKSVEPQGLDGAEKIKVFLEVSHPAEIPYDQRTRDYFSVELYRAPQIAGTP